MVVQKEQRPLIRYAGSAAETSIDSKPIGSELDARAYPKLLDSHVGRALAQSLAYLSDLREDGELRRWLKMTPLTIRTGPRVALQEQQRDPACQH